MNLNKLIRPAVKAMKSYSSARDEFESQDKDLVFLDANENPFPNGFNRYPDPQQMQLKNKPAGGARMQEGILSLMQMPRSTVAIQMLKEAGLPYIVVLTHPTTGGVTASYAMLGDVQIAEPNALICFAGPRVIEQTIREKLPEGFQRAEYLLDHGMLDRVTARPEMRDELITIVRLLLGLSPAIKGDLPKPTDPQLEDKSTAAKPKKK